MDSTSHDLLVIGSGPAGSSAAVAAASFGKRVAIVEREMALLAEAGASLFDRSCLNFPTLGNLYKLATYDALLQRLDLGASGGMKPAAAPLLVDDTALWVVRPRVALAGVSRLGTFLAGSHITLDAGKSRDRRRAFTGLEPPPAIPSDEPGRPFVLRSKDPGSLDVGSPVYFRRFRVGQVTTVAFDREGVSLRSSSELPTTGS